MDGLGDAALGELKLILSLLKGNLMWVCTWMRGCVHGCVCGCMGEHMYVCTWMCVCTLNECRIYMLNVLDNSIDGVLLIHVKI